MFDRRKDTEHGGNDYWSAIQRVASWDLTSCKLWDKQLWFSSSIFASCESLTLQANELWVYHILSCKPTNLLVVTQLVYELQAFKLSIWKTWSQPIKIWIIILTNMPSFPSILCSKIFHDARVRNFRYLLAYACFLFLLNSFVTLTANQGGSFPKSEKTEINLQDKAN